MNYLVPLLVATPLVGALACLFVKYRFIHLCGLGFLLSLGPMAALVWPDTLVSGARQYELGLGIIPLQIPLVNDGLGVLFTSLNVLISLLAGAYAVYYFQPCKPRQIRRFWTLWLLVTAANNGIYLGENLFSIYLFIEMLGLSAVGLISLSLTPQAIQSALRYLIAGLIGSLSFLVGLAVLHWHYQTLSLIHLQPIVQSDPQTIAAVGLMSTGLLLKTALFPLHFWLPEAHSQAPAPVSAFLSAVAIKTTFFLLLKLWSETFSSILNPNPGLIIGGLASLAIVWGSLQAIQQDRLKLVIAYSTIAQVGYLFLVFPLFTQSFPISQDLAIQADAWRACVYLALSHAVAKSSMFMAAGAITYFFKTDQIERLSGISKLFPLTMFSFALAGASLMGVPPSGGFVGKWYLLSAFIQSGQWLWIIPAVLGGLLSGIYVFRILNTFFLKGSAKRELGLNKKPPGFHVLEIPAFALAVLSMLLGFRAAEIFQLLEVGLPVPLQLESSPLGGSE